MIYPTLAGEWEAFRKIVIPASAPESQVRSMRDAFYAGAVSLNGMLLSGMEAGDEPTPNDLKFMENIQNEMAAYGRELEERVQAL